MEISCDTPNAPTLPKFVMEGWLQQDGLVYFPVRRHGFGTFKQIQFNENAYWDVTTEPFLIDEKELKDTAQAISFKQDIACYRNVETGEEISVPEFVKLKNDLLLKQIKVVGEDDESYTFTWERLEDKFAYDYFITLWRAQNIIVPSATTIYIKVNGEAMVESIPFITPLRKISGDLTNTLYHYDLNQHAVAVIIEEFNKRKFEIHRNETEFASEVNKNKSKQAIFIGDSVQFAKINNPILDKGAKAYLTIEIRELEHFTKLKINTFTDTFDNIKSRHEKTEKLIKEAIALYFKGFEFINSLPSHTISTLVNEVNKLKYSLLSVNTMAKTKKEYHTCINTVDKILEILKESSTK